VRCFVMAGDLQRTEEVLGIIKEKFPNTDQERSAIMLSMRLKTM